MPTPRQAAILSRGAAALLDGRGDAVLSLSMRLTRSGYSGPAMNLRRSTDNATRDFYPTRRIGNSLFVNDGDVRAWLGGASGLVTKQYDQSGAGHDVSQSTASQQPLYGVLSNGLPGMTFDGVDDMLVATPFTLNQPWTFNIVYAHATVVHSIDNVFDGNTADRGTLYLLSGHFANGMYANIGAPNLEGEWASPAQPIGSFGAVGGVFNGAGAILRVNSSILANATGNCGTNNMDGFTLGCQGGGTPSRFGNLKVSEMVAFNTAHPAAVVDADNASMRVGWRF